MSRVFLLFIVGLAPPDVGWCGSSASVTAPTAPCSSRPDAGELEGLAAETVVLRLAGRSEAVAAEAALREGLRCTRDLLNPQVSLHIVTATREADLLGPQPDEGGVSLLEATGVLFVDGHQTNARPSGRSALIQLAPEPPKAAIWSAVLSPDEELPAFRVSSVGVIRPSRLRWLDAPSEKLAGAAVVTGVLGVGSLAVAARYRTLYRRQPLSSEPDESLARANRVSGLVGYGLLGHGAGLLTAALIAGRW